MPATKKSHRTGKRTKCSGKLSPRAIATAKKRAEALEYRVQGYTFEQIGESLKVSSPRAYQLIGEALAQIPAENADALRALEGRRLDVLTTTYFPLAVQGDIKAAGIVLQVMERRARLFGLDAPVRQELTGRDGKPIAAEVRVIDADVARVALFAALERAGVLSVVQAVPHAAAKVH